MTDTKNPNGDLYVGEGVIVNCVAQVPGRAVVDGQFDGGIDAKEIEVQVNGVVSGVTQAANISVTGKINDVVQATDTLSIGSTGVVSGDISYGTLEVAKGGELLGAMKQIQSKQSKECCHDKPPAQVHFLKNAADQASFQLTQQSAGFPSDTSRNLSRQVDRRNLRIFWKIFFRYGHGG